MEMCKCAGNVHMLLKLLLPELYQILNILVSDNPKHQILLLIHLKGLYLKMQLLITALAFVKL